MKPKINPFWGALTGALVLLTLVLCGIGAHFGVLLVKTDAKPQDTVERFFTALSGGDYEVAYACLENYSGLGLERSPRTEQGKRELAALLESYDCTMLGEARITRDTAVQAVRLRRLDLAALEEALNTPLIEASENKEARYPTLEELLADAEDYYKTDEVKVQLRYVDGQWLIFADQALLSTLSGGKA